MKEAAAGLSTLPSDVSIGKVRENILSSKELNTTKITPEQEALLHGLNFREYPTIQELSAANVIDIIENSKLS